MLHKINAQTSQPLQNKDTFNVVDGESSKINGIDEQVLKCVPHSDFIYNNEIFTIAYLETLPREQVVKIAMDLLKQNTEVRKDNEQFRQQNFKMYLELRKLKKE